MGDDFSEIKGALTVSNGVASGNLLSIAQGLATFLGLETNAAQVQKLVALDYENFVFENLLDHGRRLSDVEARLHKQIWTVEEIQAEQVQKLAQLESIFERWSAQVGPSGARPSDLAAVFEAGFRVWKASADAKKRKLLGKGLRNAFDPKRYEEGLTLRLMGLLAELDYGDVYTLSLAQQNDEVGREARRAPLDDKGVTWPLRPAFGTLVENHAKRLKAHDLVRERSFSFRNARNGMTDFDGILVPTELGRRLLSFSFETEQEPPVAEAQASSP